MRKLLQVSSSAYTPSLVCIILLWLHIAMVAHNIFLHVLYKNLQLIINTYIKYIIAINKQLGNVVDMQPTEEMFEEEVMVDTTLENKDGGWDGASSW